MVNTRNHYDT
jgi:hypothetical protein